MKLQGIDLKGIKIKRFKSPDDRPEVESFWRLSHPSLEEWFPDLVEHEFRPFSMRRIPIMARSIAMRVATCAGEVQPRPRWSEVNRVLDPLLSQLATEGASALPVRTPEHVLEYMTGVQRSVYANAYKDLEEGKMWVLKQTKSDIKKGRPGRLPIGCFTKLEKTKFPAKTRVFGRCACEGCQKLDSTDPRCIFPPEALYRADLTRYFDRDNEHAICVMIDKIFGYPVVMKGYSADELGDIFYSHWQHVSKYGKPVWYALDCSRFDAHVNRKCMAKVHATLAILSENSTKAAFLLQKLEWITLEWKRKHGEVKYSPGHTVLCSGVPITSIFAIILVCSILYNHDIECIRFADMGDDFGVVAPAGWDIQQLLNDFGAVGQDVKLEGVTETFEEIVFCQHHPCLVTRKNGIVGARMIPGAKVIYSSLINLSPLQNDEYLAAVAVGHLHWARGSAFEPFFAGLLKMSGKAGSKHYTKVLGWNTKNLYKDLEEGVEWDEASFAAGIPEELEVFLDNLPEFTAPVTREESTLSCSAD